MDKSNQAYLLANEAMEAAKSDSVECSRKLVELRNLLADLPDGEQKHSLQNWLADFENEDFASFWGEARGAMRGLKPGLAQTPDLSAQTLREIDFGGKKSLHKRSDVTTIGTIFSNKMKAFRRLFTKPAFIIPNTALAFLFVLAFFFSQNIFSQSRHSEALSHYSPLPNVETTSRFDKKNNMLIIEINEIE